MSESGLSGVIVTDLLSEATLAVKSTEEPLEEFFLSDMTVSACESVSLFPVLPVACTAELNLRTIGSDTATFDAPFAGVGVITSASDGAGIGVTMPDAYAGGTVTDASAFTVVGFIS